MCELGHAIFHYWEAISSNKLIIWNWRNYVVLYIWLRFFQVKYCCHRTNWCYKKVSSSEFTSLLSRTKLLPLSADIFQLFCVLNCYYKNVEKFCLESLLQVFYEIYISWHHEYPNLHLQLTGGAPLRKGGYKTEVFCIRTSIWGIFTPVFFWNWDLLSCHTYSL